MQVKPISKDLVQRSWLKLTRYFYKEVSPYFIASKGYTHSSKGGWGDVHVDNFRMAKDIETFIDGKHYRVEMYVNLAVYQIPKPIKEEEK